MFALPHAALPLLRSVGFFRAAELERIGALAWRILGHPRREA